MSISRLIIVHNELYTLDTEFLQFSILGGIRLNGLERLRTTIKVSRIEKGDEDIKSLRFSLDLYQEEERIEIINKISESFKIKELQVSNDIQELIEELEKYRLTQLNGTLLLDENPVELSPKEIKEAETYLKKKALLERTIKDIETSGLVGEQINGLVMYLIFTSRKMKSPLHIITRGRSGLGKTYLQEKIGELIPNEDKLEITQLTSNSLYYFQQKDLHNKVLLIEDIDGVESVLYPLRELQSKKRITKLTVTKDKNGLLGIERRIVNGKVSVGAATTKERLYEDNQNRSIIIDIDDSELQTERILSYQRKQSAGLIDRKEENEVKRLFNNIQRILKEVNIINPFAENTILPFKVKNPRRTNQLYLHFIETITFYHQYQREVIIRNGEKFILSTKEDIDWANKLLKEILISKKDDLTKSTRIFYQQLQDFLKGTREFKSNEIKEGLTIHSSKLRRYLRELIENDLLEVTGNKSDGYIYELIEEEIHSK